MARIHKNKLDTDVLRTAMGEIVEEINEKLHEIFSNRHGEDENG
jgi:hypothetical protein